MEDFKQYVINYIEGRVESKQFLKKLQDNPKLIEWLQSIVPEGKIMHINQGYNIDGTLNRKAVQYNVQDSINEIWSCSGSSPLGRELNTFAEISTLMHEAYPAINLEEDTSLEEKFNFLLDACPEYLNSLEISNAGILDNLMAELPESMPKSKRVKAFKDKIKAMFYIEGQKYPRWIQESEWPLSKTGKPTKFLRQKADGEVCFYYFLDMDTKEEIEVMQAY